MPNISLYFVRHGQRIDQVDPSWTNTSPCPQDPPLTALGKLQARQTGKMIKDFAYEKTAIELAKGMRTGAASSTLAQAGQSAVSGSLVSDTAAMDKDHDKKERDVVTIAVEAGLAGK
ncbi:hypothetical protein BGZ68_010027 [Mortierella alpina]|nr:hypothetical protein BGZ68_010027 [Mortierella alpina]